MAQIDNGHDAHGAAPQVLTVGSPAIGEILADRYQVEEHIGDDAHGRQMYRGMDVVLRRPVTIVLRHPGGDSASEMLSAAVAASRVVHPHLVGVYDAIDEGDRAYVVREWIDGTSLGDAVADGPIDSSRAVAIAYAIADAVAALHEAGVVHGNVHPGTVMIAQDGRVMLADARATDLTSEESDVRAIGGVLYCALTSFWPHAEAGPAPLPDGVHDNGRLVPPGQVCAGIPAALDELTASLLDPEVQAAPAATVTAELAILAEPVEEDDLDRPGHFSAFDEAAQPAMPNPGHRRRLVSVIGALVALAVMGALAAMNLGDGSTGGGGSSKPTASTSSVSNAPGQLRQVQLSAGSVRIILGPGAGNRDDTKGAEKAVDGSMATYWASDSYNDADMKSLHTGVGVWIDLGSPQKVNQVKLEMTRVGATVELRAGDTDPGSGQSTQAGDNQIANLYHEVAKARETTGTTTVLVGSGVPVQYLLVWFTKLPISNDGRYRAEVNEITVTVQ